MDDTTNRRGARGPWFLAAAATAAVVVLVGAAVAATRGDGGRPGSPTSPAPSDDAAPVDADGWERIAPGGDCRCADGSAYNFWLREADPGKVVLFLQDGGNCFSAATCAPDRGLYTPSITEGPDAGGVFDRTDRRNPFADHSVVFVPYCTGDVHLGNATTDYAPGLTVRHKGYVNGTAALDHLAAAFPGATEVVVMGESAGSVAAPFYAGLVSDRLPGARVTVLANGSGGTPTLPDDVARSMATGWGLAGVVPPWPATAGLAAEQWFGVPALFVHSGRHDPDITFARVDYAFDERQRLGAAHFGAPAADLPALLDANEAQVEEAGVPLLSYVAAGDRHGVLSDGRFTTEAVGDQTLADWVARLVAGEPVDDVRCTDCTAG